MFFDMRGRDLLSRDNSPIQHFAHQPTPVSYTSRHIVSPSAYEGSSTSQLCQIHCQSPDQLHIRSQTPPLTRPTISSPSTATTTHPLHPIAKMSVADRRRAGKPTAPLLSIRSINLTLKPQNHPAPLPTYQSPNPANPPRPSPNPQNHQPTTGTTMTSHQKETIKIQNPNHPPPPRIQANPPAHPHRQQRCAAAVCFARSEAFLDCRVSLAVIRSRDFHKV